MEPGGSVAATGVLGLIGYWDGNMEWSQIEDSMQSITTETTEPNEALGKKTKDP
jgi:hypothetical protein